MERKYDYMTCKYCGDEVYLSVNSTCYRERLCPKCMDGSRKDVAETLLKRWYEELENGTLSAVDWTLPGADYLLPLDTQTYYATQEREV